MALFKTQAGFGQGSDTSSHKELSKLIKQVTMTALAAITVKGTALDLVLTDGTTYILFRKVGGYPIASSPMASLSNNRLVK